MANVKKKAIPLSRYYDGRKKQWNYSEFQLPCRPSIESVNYWINEWGKKDGNLEQESALKKLFTCLCPNNTELDDVLIKVCTLNDFYSTNIYKVFDVAKAIIELGIDVRLAGPKADYFIVDEIDQAVKKTTGRHVYSFATKYCSHHRPELYPIYDSYVGLLLRYYRDFENCPAFTFADKDLLTYAKLGVIEEAFKEHFGLTRYNAKEIDIFLWQEGKKCFPQYESTDE